MMSELPDAPDLDTFSEQAAILRAVLNAAVDAIITIDERGVIRQANLATARMFGYDPAELIGRNVSVLMPSPYREEHDGYLKNYLKTGEAQIIGIGREVLGRHKDGSLIPVDLAVSEAPVGRLRLFTGIIRDMRERKRVELALRRERHFSQDLESTASAIIVILDMQSRIVRFNPFLEQLSGYDVASVRGRHWTDVFIPEEDRPAHRELLHRVAAGQPLQGYVDRIQTRHGSIRTIVWSIRHILDSDSIVDGILAIGTDITELKDAEARLIQSERLAAIGQMVTGLAHESRNALQRAHAYLEMLELETGDEAEQQDLIQRSQQALRELQRLYEEVRNYAAPVKLDCSECRLTALIRETWEAVTSTHVDRHVKLVLAGGDDVPVCHCDEDRVQQVLRNVFENSIFVSPDGATVSCEITLAANNIPPALRITIRDQGPGLTAEQAKRIFEPFYTTKTKGTGLGMAIARRIVEAHGGTIAIRSEPSRESQTCGAEVVIQLPVHPNPEASAASAD